MSAVKHLSIPSGQLNASIENEILQSYVSKSDGANDPPNPQDITGMGHLGEDTDPKPKRRSRGIKSKSAKGRTASAASQQKNRRKRKTINPEELYTDKDRAAAVNMGSKDIKQSLKLKRQEDRSKNLLIPEEADPAQYLVLGYYEMGRRELQIALNFFNKAVELNPLEKHALVARSKCYIMLGQPDKGLQDAETALVLDKSFLKAIYQKAEALYHLGDFEHSLMYFHRGLHVRPDHEDFRAGVEKAQKAIENALGIGVEKKPPRPSSRSRAATPARSKAQSAGTRDSKRSVSATPASKPPKNRLLRELAVDKEYLDNLLCNPDILCKAKEGDKDPVIGFIQEAVHYLNQRQEFWRQQVPPKKN